MIWRTDMYSDILSVCDQKIRRHYFTCFKATRDLILLLNKSRIYKHLSLKRRKPTISTYFLFLMLKFKSFHKFESNISKHVLKFYYQEEEKMLHNKIITKNLLLGN